MPRTRAARNFVSSVRPDADIRASMPPPTLNYSPNGRIPITTIAVGALRCNARLHPSQTKRGVIPCRPQKTRISNAGAASIVSWRHIFDIIARYQDGIRVFVDLLGAHDIELELGEERRQRPNAAKTD